MRGRNKNRPLRSRFFVNNGREQKSAFFFPSL